MWIKPAILILLLIFMFTVTANEIVKSQRKKFLNQIPQETIPGAISQWLTYLVGMAGGIYISLIALTSFLKIAFPETVYILGVSVDPLAILSLLLALIQPWLIKFFNFLNSK